MSPVPPMIVKNCSARKSLRLSTEVWYVKKTAVSRVGADKSKLKATRAGSMLWYSITNRKGNKNNPQVKKYLYNWILQYPQVVQYPIDNDLLKVSIDGHSKPQLVPNFLLQVSAQELHNNMVIYPEEGGSKETRYAENNIIIIDSTQ